MRLIIIIIITAIIIARAFHASRDESVRWPVARLPASAAAKWDARARVFQLRGERAARNIGKGMPRRRRGWPIARASSAIGYTVVWYGCWIEF